jgi:ABC-type transport system substrate-binding protein
VVFDACQKYWNQTGIPVQPDPATTSSILDTFCALPRDYDGALFHFDPDPPGPSPVSLATWTSGQIANPYGNFLNWANTSYDTILDAMLTSADYDSVLQAAHDAQQVFVHEAPMIVLGWGYVMNAYRTDRFTGWLVSPGVGIGYENLWVPRKVCLLSNQPERDAANGCGGTLRTMIGQDMDSQNPLLSVSAYGGYVLGQIYDSLIGLEDPRTHQPIKSGGGLAYDWTATLLADGLQFDFILFSNATWHDGVPVTADDVTFTYNYIKNCSAWKYAGPLAYLNACVAIDSRHVRIVTNSTSYWAFESLRDWPILPKHLWQGIVSPLTFTNPEPIGSGPFRWYRRVESEYVELQFWELYHKGILDHTIRTPWIEPPNPVPLAVLIVFLTLLGSIAYLTRPKQSSTKTKARVEVKHYESPPNRGMRHFCQSCGGELLGDETYCPRCGHRVA